MISEKLITDIYERTVSSSLSLGSDYIMSSGSLGWLYSRQLVWLPGFYTESPFRGISSLVERIK